MKHAQLRVPLRVIPGTDSAFTAPMRKFIFISFTLFSGCSGIDRDLNEEGRSEALCLPGRRCVDGETNQGRYLAGDLSGYEGFAISGPIYLFGKPVANYRALQGHLEGNTSTGAKLEATDWAGSIMRATKQVAQANGTTLTLSRELRIAPAKTSYASAEYGGRTFLPAIPAAEDTTDPWLQGIEPTHLYLVEYRDSSSGTWQPWCRPDLYKSAYAIPVPINYDEKGHQQVLDDPYAPFSAAPQSKGFAWACMAGVSAKAIKWGYLPWFQPNAAVPAQMLDIHWAVTRAARADYCGDGVRHTEENTLIQIWDNATTSPILTNPDPTGPVIDPLPTVDTRTALAKRTTVDTGLTAGDKGTAVDKGTVLDGTKGSTSPAGDTKQALSFEAGWSKNGAVCISHLRWQHLNHLSCPDSYPPPWANVDGTNFCDNQAEAEQKYAGSEWSPRVFNKSRVNDITINNGQPSLGQIDPLPNVLAQ